MGHSWYTPCLLYPWSLCGGKFHGSCLVSVTLIEKLRYNRLKISFNCHWKDTLSQFPRKSMPHHGRDHTGKHPVWSGDRGQGAGELCAKATIIVSLRKKQIWHPTFSAGYIPQPHTAIPHPTGLLHFIFSGTYYLLYNLLIMLIVCHHPPYTMYISQKQESFFFTDVYRAVLRVWNFRVDAQ